MIEIETTIKNGLPVLARGTVTKYHQREYPGRDCIEDLEVLWPSGKPCYLAISDTDYDRLAHEIFDAARH